MDDFYHFFVRPIVTFLFLICYLAIGFYPFNWQLWLPETLDNRAVMISNELHFQAPGIAYTLRAPLWLNELESTSSLRIQLELHISQIDLHGPARILTISQSPLLRNLTIGQDGADLIIRLRSQTTDLNGMPSLIMQDAFRNLGWYDIEVIIDPENIRVFVDNQVILAHALSANTMGTWSADYKLALGNELLGDRAWLGKIRKVIVGTDDRQIDYLAPGALHLPQSLLIPDQYRNIPKIKLSPFSKGSANLQIVVTDVMLNFFGFILLGFVILQTFRKKMSIVAVTLLCATVSLTLELGQMFLPSRVTTASDFMLNTLGGAVGAWCARFGDRRGGLSHHFHKRTSSTS